MGLLHLLSLLPLALACEGGACAASRAAALLSFKAELARGAASEDEARDGAKNGTVCANCSNTSLEHLVMDVILEDMNASGNMPNPEGENNTAGSLGQNLEFLFLKVAQLETAVELQNINFNMAKQDLEHAQMEIQELKDHLVQKNLALEQMRARLLKLDGSKEQIPALGSKHRAAHLAQIRAKRKQRGTEAEKILLKVLKKHQRQAQRGWHEEKKPLKDMKASMTQRSALEGQSVDLDESVAAKGSVPIVDDIVDAGEDLVDGATDVINSGTGLVGDALSDAYNAAADKVEFVANTVIDTVEQVVAILSQGFDWSASCPNWSNPSLSVSDSGIAVDWGRQRCRITLVGQSMNLFDFNWGTTSVSFPAPIQAMVAMGQEVGSCLSNSGATSIFKCIASFIGDTLMEEVPAFKMLFALAEQMVQCTGDALDVFACIATKMGDTILQLVPPFNFLTQLGSILSEFVAFFAELAGALIHGLVTETTSLMQEAVTGKFPDTGEKSVQVNGRKGLTVHVRKQQGPASLLQRDARKQEARKPSNDVDNGIVGFGTTEALPYASMLITQFGGDEFDSGSCLAFAPSHRSGTNGNVTKRDWQVPSPDSEDFVKLEPWAVPCDNQWAKDNPNKWEGYSFYTYESVIEKCAAVTYSISAQPVVSFVAGLEFDLLPAPLMEITTEVCWPDRVSAPDLSLIVITARSAGIVLFSHTLRLHKRFGNVTDFVDGSYNEAVERPANYFGKGTAADDDKALEALGRAALLQGRGSSFRVSQEELFLASAKYDRHMGLNITARYEGRAAAERVKKALNLAQGDEGALGNHELFELASPSNSLVGFSVIGELAAGMLQLKVKMSFGSIDSPTKEIPLVNLVDHLRVVLAAIPFVSQASKEKAIESMSSTHFEIPSPVTEGALDLVSGITELEGATRDAVLARSGGVCSMEAVLNMPSAKDMATLPEDCRPGHQMIFNVPTASTATSKTSSARVDIFSDGLVQWVEGDDTTWLSLAGLVFPLGSGWPLSLVNGWTNKGSPYADASYTRVGSLCFLRGRVQYGGTWGEVVSLPEDCRPARSLQFAMRVSNGNARVDVANGAVTCESTWGGGNWLSLDGIAFTVDLSIESLGSAVGPPSLGISLEPSRSPLPLSLMWTADTDAAFGPITYTKTNGHCILQGRVIAGGTVGMVHMGTIATLPVECWPMRKLIFNAGLNTERDRIEVDVSEYGEVTLPVLVTSGDSISLSGLMFTAPSDDRRLLPVRSSWVSDRPGSWGEAAFDMKNGLCRVEARLTGGDRTAPGLLAVLPEGCRPKKRLCFNVNRHRQANRVDVYTTGEVHFEVGSNGAAWIPLAGIYFAPGNAGRMNLPLTNGWVAKAGYGVPEVVQRNGFCAVEAVVQGTAYSQSIATLPTECRPTRRLVFNQATDARARVDVYSNGDVKWADSGQTNNWVSLAMVFVPDDSQGVELVLENGWQHMGGSYGNAMYILKDGVCALQGIVKNGVEGNVIATLPTACCPKNLLIFGSNWLQCAARIDVAGNGQISWRDSSCSSDSSGWLSLSGISFVSRDS